MTNGESAANTLRQTSIGGAVLPWRDALHEGPVRPGPRRELLRARAAFLSACGWGSRRAILSSLELRDHQFVEALRNGVEVVLWFEHDLYDQLQLLDALALASEAGGSLELVRTDSFLGGLTAEELETLWPTRLVAAPDLLATASSVWDAFRAPEPSALAEWAARGVEELPFLAPALQRLLEELPAPGDGLSGTERRALRAIAAGASTPARAFVAAKDLEEAMFLGDTWFYRTLAELGRGDVRLVETATGEELPPPPPLGDVHVFAPLPLELTSRGERVLSGAADRVELLGIDRWLGGTHLTPSSMWRWDPVGRVLVPPTKT